MKFTIYRLLSLAMLCAFSSEGLAKASDDDEVEQVIASVYARSNSDPIENAELIIDNYNQVLKYQGKERAMEYWNAMRGRLAWIVVYLGENSDADEAVIQVLNKIDENFKLHSFPNGICFKSEHDDYAWNNAHMHPTQWMSHGFTSDRPVGELVRIALWRIKQRDVKVDSDD